MGTIYIQTDSAEAPIPWYKICHIRDLSADTREKLRLQATLLASYLFNDAAWTESWRDSRGKAIALITASARGITKRGHLATGCLHEAKIHSTLSIINEKLPPPGLKYESWYNKAIWLVSRILSKGYALIVACAIEKREVLNRVTFVHILYYLDTEKALQECASSCERFLEGKLCALSYEFALQCYHYCQEISHLSLRSGITPTAMAHQAQRVRFLVQAP